MKSPLTHKNDSRKIGEIAGSFLCDQYKVKLNIDIERLIPKSKNIEIYKCRESDLVFFKGDFQYGDSKFYEDLEKIDWYYSDWKWEYEKAFHLINDKEKVLDVGCGFGYFLEKLKKEKSCSVEGIEFNESAYQKNIEKGLEISNKPVEEFAKDNVEQFDVVCSFQVLEHIENPISFLEAKLKCLKKDGKLIIAVPNNDSFIKYSEDNVLNMPPHHTLLWNKKSLDYLTKVLPIKRIKIFYQDVDKNHSWYKEVIDIIINKNKLLALLYNNISFSRQQIRKLIGLRLNQGHSMMIVYQKT